jgi:hypothetical protein
VFLFIAATWAFGAFTIFATPASVFVASSFPVQTASLTPWSPIAHTCAVGTCLSTTILLSVLIGGIVVVLYPSLLVTALTWLRFSVRVQAQLHGPVVPEAHPLTPLRPSATPVAPRASSGCLSPLHPAGSRLAPLAPAPRLAVASRPCAGGGCRALYAPWRMAMWYHRLFPLRASTPLLVLTIKI